MRSGFVNIIGNPNVGKSTLMNALVGEKLSIVTSKAQTTRHRIMGIVNGPDYQAVFSDTPGILKPSYRLQESMMNFVDTAIGDADVILYVTDIVEKKDKNREYVEKLSKVACPVMIAINKIDLGTQEQVLALMKEWKELVPAADIFPFPHRRSSTWTTSSTPLPARCPTVRPGTTGRPSPTVRCASSPRKSSGRRY